MNDLLIDEFHPVASKIRRRFLTTSFVVGLGGGMTASFVVVLASKLGASDALAGVVSASNAMALLIADTLGARMILRLDPRRSIAIGCALFGVGSALCGIAPTPVVVLIGRSFQGFGAAFFMASSLQLTTRLAARGRELHDIGVYNAIWFSGISLGPLAGGIIAHFAGLRTAFIVCAFVNLAGSAGARLLLPGGPIARAAPDAKAANGFYRLPTRLRRPLLVGAACQGLRGGVSITLIPLFASHYLGLSVLGVGLIATVLAASDITAMRVSAIAADRFGRSRTLATSLLIGASGAALTALDPTTAVLALGCVMIGVAVGTAWVVPAALAADRTVDSRSAIAAFRVASDIGMLGGSIAAGAALGALGGASAFAWTAFALVLLALAVSRTGESESSPRPHRGLVAAGSDSGELVSSGIDGFSVHEALCLMSPVAPALTH
jgi:MFS family permease